jgi:hypothetical protein
MYLQNVLIGVAPINVTKLDTPGYIEHLKNQLEEDHSEILDLGAHPEYFIENLPSSMNAPRKKIPLN